MSNNVSNTSEEYDEEYYYDSLDLLGSSSLVNAFLQRDGIHSFLPNIIFSSEFKTLYSLGDSSIDVANNNQNLSSINRNETIKNRNLYFFEMQYFLRNSYKELLENFIKYIATDEIAALSEFCRNSNLQSDRYNVFREYIDKTFPEIIESTYSLNFGMNKQLLDQFSFLSSDTNEISKFQKFKNLPGSDKIVSALDESLDTLMLITTNLDNKESVKGIFKSFILARVIQFETYKSLTYNRLINTKKDYELYEQAGSIDSSSVFTQNGQFKLPGEFLDLDFLNNRNFITDDIRTLHPCEFLNYNRHQLNLGFYNFHKLFNIDKNQSIIQPTGQIISQNEADFIKLYLSGKNNFSTGIPKYLSSENDSNNQQSGSKKILNIGIPNGLVTKLNIERWSNIASFTGGVSNMNETQENNFNPNYISTLRVDIYKTDLLDPHNKKYKRIRKYFDMDTFTFNDGNYDVTDINDEVAKSQSLGNLGNVSNYLSKNFNDIMTRDSAINNFPVYKIINGLESNNKEKNLDAPVFKPVTINAINNFSNSIINSAFEGASSIEDVKGIDKTYSGETSEIIKSIIRNHIEDHVLKNYSKIMMGIDLSEENFHFKFGKLMNIGHPLENLNANSESNGFEKDNLLKIVDLFISDDSKEDNLIDGIDVSKVLEKELKKSLIFAGPTYSNMCLRPKKYDRIFSILIDDRMFELSSDSNITNENYSYDKDAARMCKYEINISLADHNFNYDYASPTSLKSQNFYNHRIDFTPTIPSRSLFPNISLTETELEELLPRLNKTLKQCQDDAINVLHDEYHKIEETFLDSSSLNSATYGVGDASESSFSSHAQTILNIINRNMAVTSFFNRLEATFLAHITPGTQTSEPYYELSMWYGDNVYNPVKFYFNASTEYAAEGSVVANGLVPGGDYDVFGNFVMEAYEGSSLSNAYANEVYMVLNSNVSGLIYTLFGILYDDSGNTAGTQHSNGNTINENNDILESLGMTMQKSEIIPGFPDNAETAMENIELGNIALAFKDAIRQMTIWPTIKDYFDYEDSKDISTPDGTLSATFTNIYTINTLLIVGSTNMDEVLTNISTTLASTNSPPSFDNLHSTVYDMLTNLVGKIRGVLLGDVNINDINGARRLVIRYIKTTSIGILAGKEGHDTYQKLIMLLMSIFSDLNPEI